MDGIGFNWDEDAIESFDPAKDVFFRKLQKRKVSKGRLVLHDNEHVRLVKNHVLHETSQSGKDVQIQSGLKMPMTKWTFALQCAEEKIK